MNARLVYLVVQIFSTNSSYENSLDMLKSIKVIISNILVKKVAGQIFWKVHDLLINKIELAVVPYVFRM